MPQATREKPRGTRGGRGDGRGRKGSGRQRASQGEGREQAGAHRRGVRWGHAFSHPEEPECTSVHRGAGRVKRRGAPL
eukprot:5055063-Prorocentrum_lima.AAC.1